MITAPATLPPRVFNLNGLRGISDETLNMHLALYEGYVSATNALNAHLFDFVKDGKVDHEDMPAYLEFRESRPRMTKKI